MKINTKQPSTRIFVLLGMLFISVGSWSLQASIHPKEALSACFDKEQGDLCEFNNEQGVSVNGRCQGLETGEGKLYCQPTN